jgi:hypothetical protein
MTAGAYLADLVVLTADKNCQFALRGIVSRGESLGIHAPRADYFVHPEKDPGVLRHAHDFLRAFARSHAHALVVMDREGCGRDDPRDHMEREVEQALSITGWEDRAAAVVITPELEAWVFSDSPHVANALGWGNRRRELLTWLRAGGFLAPAAQKPAHPKEALEAALRHVRKARSSSIYGDLAKRVSLNHCTDAAFQKLTLVLRTWFG